MRVRALKSFASPVITVAEDEEFDCADEQAVAWIKAGLVARVPEEPRTATARPAETAVTRKGR